MKIARRRRIVHVREFVKLCFEKLKKISHWDMMFASLVICHMYLGHVVHDTAAKAAKAEGKRIVSFPSRGAAAPVAPPRRARDDDPVIEHDKRAHDFVL